MTTGKRRTTGAGRASAPTRARSRRPPSASVPAEAIHLLLFPDVETFAVVHRPGLAAGILSVGLSTPAAPGDAVVLRAGFVREKEQHDLAGRIVDVDPRPGPDGFRAARVELSAASAMAIRARAGVAATVPPAPRRTRATTAARPLPPPEGERPPGAATQARMLSELDGFLAELERKLGEPSPAAPRPLPRRRVIDDSELAVSFQRLPRADQVRLAISGDRVARGFIIRKGKADLHRMLLGNPRLEEEEVLAVASIPTTSGDVLERIGHHPSWTRSEAMRLALVTNPRSPVPLALRFVPTLSLGNLRKLARSRDLRRPIDALIRKQIAERPK